MLIYTLEIFVACQNVKTTFSCINRSVGYVRLSLSKNDQRRTQEGRGPYGPLLKNPDHLTLFMPSIVSGAV